jgi:hypothetical protein
MCILQVGDLTASFALNILAVSTFGFSTVSRHAALGACGVCHELLLHVVHLRAHAAGKPETQAFTSRPQTD